MKTKKILASLALSLAVVFAVVLFSSFKPAKRCTVTCNFTASTSTIFGAGIDNCNGSQSTPTVTSTYSPTLAGGSCSYINITASVGGTHAPGALRVYKNSVLVDSWSIGTNQSGGFDQQYSATCGDVFDVTW